MRGSNCCTTYLLTKLQIHNFGTQPIGEQGASTGRTYRMAEVVMTIPQQYGRMISSLGVESAGVDQPVSFVRPRDVGTMV